MYSSSFMVLFSFFAVLLLNRRDQGQGGRRQRGRGRQQSIEEATDSKEGNTDNKGSRKRHSRRCTTKDSGRTLLFPLFVSLIAAVMRSLVSLLHQYPALIKKGGSLSSLSIMAIKEQGSSYASLSSTSTSATIEEEAEAQSDHSPGTTVRGRRRREGMCNGGKRAGDLTTRQQTASAVHCCSCLEASSDERCLRFGFGHGHGQRRAMMTRRRGDGPRPGHGGAKQRLGGGVCGAKNERWV